MKRFSQAPWLALLAAALAILGYWTFGVVYLDGFRLDLGSVRIPTPGYMLMASLLAWLGLPAVAFLTVAFTRLLEGEPLERLKQAWLLNSDRATILLAFALGALVPLAVGSAVLAHAPLSDDEAAYRFSAELLASGRLWVASAPMKLFFDNVFLINDGKMYGQYFLGWPLLLAVGVKLGLPWLINPLLSGVTAIAVFLVGRAFWSAAWGRVAVVVFLGSPFLMVAAATGLSQTTVICCFAWALLFLTRIDTGAARAWNSAALAALLCLAFWTRPSVGLGFGAPLVLAWALGLKKAGRSAAVPHLLAFCGVAAALGALFLLSNQALNGAPLQTGYHAAVRYAIANQARFWTTTAPSKTAVAADGFLFFFHERSAAAIAGKFIVAAIRLNIDGFGWPLSLGLAPLARGRWARWMAALIFGFALAHLPLADAGIDSFGPVHFAEVMLPLVLLTTGGLRTLWGFGARIQVPALAPAALGALLSVSALTFVPTRWLNLARLAADINAPIDAVEEQAPPGALVFTQRPFARFCRAAPARHFVLSRPNNDPDLQNPVLWANHVSLARDRQLVEAMPGRTGYLLVADAACRYSLVPLEQADEARFPPAIVELPGDFAAPAPASAR